MAAIAASLKLEGDNDQLRQVVDRVLARYPEDGNDRLPPVLVEMLTLLPFPAYIRDPIFNVLESNSAAQSLSAALTPGSNLVRALFLDATTRELVGELAPVEAWVVGELMARSEREPPDSEALALIAELSGSSRRFRDLTEVKPDVPEPTIIVWHHWLGGVFQTRTARMTLPGSQQLELVIFGAPLESVGAAALQLLDGNPAFVEATRRGPRSINP